MKKTEIFTGYTPRPHQADLHRSLKRFSVIVAHRRFGKTVACVNELIDRGLRNPLKHPRYAYIAPFRDQAKRVAWDGASSFKEYTQNLPGIQYNESELRVNFPRKEFGDTVQFQLYGAENADAIRGVYFDGVVLDEFGVMDSTIWSEVVRPALSDRNGFAIFIGTPKGKNRFFDLYNFAKREMRYDRTDWFAAMYKASDTGVLAQKELEALRREMGDELYRQEYECDFLASNKGTYYAHHMESAEAEGRVKRVPHQLGHPVYTAWDLGLDDAMAIWFWQQVGGETHIIDYYEDQKGTGMLGALGALVEGERNKYLYHTHFVPHDGQSREMSGRIRVQDLIDFNKGRVDFVAKLSVHDGIHQVGKTLPKCYFDDDRTELGRDRLRSYSRKWDRKREIFLGEPQHDESSHGADAFRYLAIAIRQELSTLRDGKDMFSIVEYDPLAPGEW
jgi:phage terminase large subunit